MLTAKGLFARPRALQPHLFYKENYYIKIRFSATVGLSRFAVNKKYASFEAGERLSGHIRTGPNEGIFFFDSQFPKACVETGH